MSATPTTAFGGQELQRMLHQFQICQATELARNGSYSSAESLLKELVQQPTAPGEALALQARICAQQGRLGEAARWWQKVLDREPANGAAQAGLARLNRMQKQPVWIQVVWPLLVGAGALLGLLLLSVWQGHRQTAANAQLHERMAEGAKAEGRIGREAVVGLVAEIQTVKSTLARTEGSLAKLSDFNAKIDGWQATQGAMSEQLKAVQGEIERLAGQQATLALSASNQASVLDRKLDQSLGTAKEELEAQLKLLREDGERLAARHAAFALANSNQVVALRQAIDREHALVSEIDRRRVESERLQSDYQALTTRHEQVLAAVGLAGKPPSISLAVPGVCASVSGKEIIVTFEDGLFDQGTHFKQGAKNRLLAVGKTLAGSSEPLEMKVVGHADDDRAFLKWTARWESALALERASAVVRYFIELGLFESHQLSGQAGDSQKRPYASDSMQSRLRNRTVVLRIARDRQN